MNNNNNRKKKPGVVRKTAKAKPGRARQFRQFSTKLVESFNPQVPRGITQALVYRFDSPLVTVVNTAQGVALPAAPGAAVTAVNSCRLGPINDPRFANWAALYQQVQVVTMEFFFVSSFGTAANGNIFIFMVSDVPVVGGALPQTVTGIFLAIHYAPNVEYAFSSVIHINRDVEYG